MNNNVISYTLVSYVLYLSLNLFLLKNAYILFTCFN